MRLLRLDLTRYGKFTDQTIHFGPRPAGAPDLHVIYGLNEAGKSTTLAAYLDLLFGIEERSAYAFLHPYNVMEIGAALEFGDAVHELRRVKQRANSLRDAAGQPVAEALLGTPLAGLTRDAYRMMFSLDDQTLEEGGNAILESKGDLGELLFSASAGLADLGRTLEEIEKEADGLFRKRASSTEIAKLKTKLKDLKAEREKIDVQASAYAALIASREQARAAYEVAARERAQQRVQQEEIGRILRAVPLARDYRGAVSDLAAMGELPHPPAHWADELPALMRDATQLETRLAGLDASAERLKDMIAGISIDGPVLALGERFEQLGRARTRFEAAEEDLPKRRNALAGVEARLGTVLRALGRDGEADPAVLEVPAPVAGTLRDLIEQRSGMAAAATAARGELASAAEALARAREDLEALNASRALDDAGRMAALREMVTRLRQSDLAARQRVAGQDLPRLRRLFEEAVAGLAPWSGDGPALAALAVPDAARIGAWRSALSVLEGHRASHRDRLSDLVTQEREQEARLAPLGAAMESLDDGRAAAVRAERDAAWKKHRAALDAASADVFEARLSAADRVADERFTKADDLARWRSLTEALALIRVQVARQRELLTEVESKIGALGAEMRGAVAGVVDGEGDAPLSQLLSRIERWTRGRDAALDAFRQWRTAADAADAAQAEAGQAREALTALLQACGAATDGFSLPALGELAETMLADAADLKKARETAGKALREREREQAGRLKAAEEAQAAMGAWQARWDGALAQTWFADRGAETGAVRAILDALGQLPADLRERTDFRHRITAMERDRDAFLAELTALMGTLGERLDGDAVLPAARALARRHEQALQAVRLRKDKETELARVAAERESLAAEMAVHGARKAEMLTFFGVADLVAVDAALRHCAARDRREAERDRLGVQILAELGSACLKAVLEQLDAADLAALTAQGAELAGRLEDLDEEVKLRFSEFTRAEDRLNAVGGDDAVARLEATRRTMLLDIEDQAQRYLRLKAGAMMAAQALRLYREKHRSSMMARASDAFGLITRGAYRGLATRVDKEREALIALSSDGASKLAADLSKGTRFQLYLALRLAGYAEFAAVRPSVPFIADDIMETFDEPRSEEVFRLFARMAEVGQVIYLTHHRHLCEIARKVAPQVRIHELSPRPA